MALIEFAPTGRSPEATEQLPPESEQLALQVPEAKVIVPVAAAVAQAPPPKAPPTYEQVIVRSWKSTHDKILVMAKDTVFPDAKLSYKPHPDSRTMAQELRHVTIGLEATTAQAKGEKYDFEAKEKEIGAAVDAVAAAEAHRPAVAVLDIAMPILNGIEATRQIRRRVSGTRVLILSMHADEAYVIQAVQAGARGYVLKESAGAEIVEAIAALRAGRSFFSPAVASIMLDDYVRALTERGLTDRYDSLSEREREVLQLVAEGRSTKEIADLLSISVATVETHRAHILQKLDLKNTAGIVLFAARRGIVS